MLRIPSCRRQTLYPHHLQSERFAGGEENMSAYLHRIVRPLQGVPVLCSKLYQRTKGKRLSEFSCEAAQYAGQLGRDTYFIGAYDTQQSPRMYSRTYRDKRKDMAQEVQVCTQRHSLSYQ